MKSTYTPVDPDYFDIVEKEIAKNKLSTIYFFENNNVVDGKKGRIKKIETVDNFEKYVLLQSGKRLRLDRVITISSTGSCYYDKRNSRSGIR